MKIGKKQIAVAGILVVLAAGGIFLSTNVINASSNTQGETISLPPAVETVRTGDISEIVTASGTVSASETNGIYIATTQKVADVKVKLGDKVKVGDVLVEYDVDYSKKELENNLATQRINLQSANLSLKSLTTGKSEAEMLQLESSVTSAEKSLLDANNSLETANKQIADLENDLIKAKKDVEDNEKLLAVGAITQETYDDSVKAVSDAEKSIEDKKATIQSLEMSISNAESSLKQANLNLSNAADPLSDESAKNSYQKQLYEIEKSKLSIENIEDQISDLVEASYSHVDGTVIELNVEEGSVVNDQTNIMKIADLNQLIVNANVSEYDAPLLKVGQKVTITTDAISGALYEGEITYISPVANVTSTFSGNETTVAIEVTINNPDGVLKPGYSVDMEILVTDEKDTNIISLSAIQKDNEKNSYYVYTVDGSDIIHKTYIEMGVSDDMSAQVLSGLSEGDRVVTSPTSSMEDNTALDGYTREITIPAGVGNGNAPAGAGSMGGNAIIMPSGGAAMSAPSGGGGPQGGGGQMGGRP